ncbi:hypothetical protein H5410_025856 [Solanum commersonii]|uniref:Protein FAR1-RELATED SEQUENCE n=1 Tax=Solanum commersonii TaxID=4109 RepID=A0A9J5YZ43_SOLCO|nr:hypothetical protein H5410_025856 [Solanum commersonii]
MASVHTRRIYTRFQHEFQVDNQKRSVICLNPRGWLCLSRDLRFCSFDLNFSSIPEKYILKRWSKNAKYMNRFAEYTKKLRNNKIFYDNSLELANKLHGDSSNIFLNFTQNQFTI